MSKVICDICGTVYQDTAESCPICGYSQVLEDDYEEEFLLEDTGPIKGGRFAQSRKNKELFDYDEEDPDEDEYDDDEDEEYEEEEEYDRPKSNAVIVVILVIVIMLLLAAIGFVFFRYFLPNLDSGDVSHTPALIATEAAETESTTEPTIPCESIVLTGGIAELSKEGQYWLLHVKVMPEDTTDDLVYISEDESIATVTQDGRITAIGEGETTIYITCGKQQINCPVIVKFAEETEPSEGETAAGATGETEAETTAPELLDVTLALEQYDISLPVGYGVTLHLDCPLAATDVEWTVEHPHIATVDENGFVKAVGYGTTAVIVKYGDQEVTCMIRCK